MDDGNNFTEGGANGATSGTSDTAGSRSGDSGPKGTTFNFADSFTGSGSKASSENGSNAGGAYAEAPIGKKRRGRQPYPRDENGNIIRPAGSSDKGNKVGLGVKTVRNDRASMKGQIDTFFKLAAQFTRMPHWMLSDQEASLEANATCDLADAMGWDLSVTGSPIGAAVIFVVTTVSIVKPRIDETIRIANAVNITPSSPATAGEARGNGISKAGAMDFSADIDAAVNKGETVQ